MVMGCLQGRSSLSNCSWSVLQPSWHHGWTFHLLGWWTAWGSSSYPSEDFEMGFVAPSLVSTNLMDQMVMGSWTDFAIKPLEAQTRLPHRLPSRLPRRCSPTTSNLASCHCVRLAYPRGYLTGVDACDCQRFSSARDCLIACDCSIAPDALGRDCRRVSLARDCSTLPASQAVE